MARMNYLNARNYKEPFYFIKVLRPKVSGSLANESYATKLIYGSVMASNLSMIDSEFNDATSNLSIKFLKPDWPVEVNDYVYRGNYVYKVIQVDSDLFNRQEIKVICSFYKDIKELPALLQVINLSEHKLRLNTPIELNVTQTEFKAFKNTLKDELNNKQNNLPNSDNKYVGLKIADNKTIQIKEIVTDAEKAVWNAKVSTEQLDTKQNKLTSEQLTAIQNVKNKLNINEFTSKVQELTNQLNTKQANLSTTQLTNIEQVPNKANASDVFTQKQVTQKLATKQATLTQDQLNAIGQVANKVNVSDYITKANQLQQEISQVTSTKLNTTRTTGNVTTPALKYVPNLPELSTLDLTFEMTTRADGNLNYFVKLKHFDTEQKAKWLFQALKQSSAEIQEAWFSKLTDLFDTNRVSNQSYTSIYSLSFNDGTTRASCAIGEGLPVVGCMGPNADNSIDPPSNAVMDTPWKFHNKEAVKKGFYHIIRKYNWVKEDNNPYFAVNPTTKTYVVNTNNQEQIDKISSLEERVAFLETLVRNLNV